MFRRSISSSRGSTLVSAAVAAATVALLSLSTIKVLEDRRLGADAARSRQALVKILEDVRLTSESSEGCTSMLTGASPSFAIAPGSAVDLASIPTGSTAVSTGSSGPMSISKIQLRDRAGLPPTFDSSGTLRNHRRLELLLEGTLVKANLPILFRKRFFFDVLTDGGNRIVSCYRGQDNDKVACETMAGSAPGTYSASPRTCHMPPQGITAATCPLHQCVGGFDNDNKVICRAEL